MDPYSLELIARTKINEERDATRRARFAAEAIHTKRETRQATRLSFAGLL